MTSWQEETQEKLDALGALAKARNKSLTLTIPDGEYDLHTLTIPPHVSLVSESRSARSVRLRYIGEGHETVLSMAGGYGSLVQGFEIVTNKNQPRLIGIRINSAVNGSVKNMRIDFRGQDTIGVSIAGKESVKIESVESRAMTPLEYVWGDNVVIRDADLGCTNGIMCVLIAGMPHQVTFDGFQTWQGGRHAIFGIVNTPSSGQGLNIYNLRYEQSTSLSDPNFAAIHLEFTDRHLENLLMVGCRWTVRQNAWYIKNVRAISQLGSFLPGTKTSI